MEGDVDVLDVWFLTECEALCNVAHCYNHILICVGAWNVLYLSINQLFIQLHILQLRSHIHYMQDAVRDVVVVVFSVFNIKQINLVVEHLYTDQNSSFLLAAAAHGLHLACFIVPLEQMLVIIVGRILAEGIEEKGQ